MTIDGAQVFRANDLRPRGRPNRWALRLIEKRDTSDLQNMAVDVAAADSRDAIVVDGTSSSSRFGGERGSPIRTVGVFVDGAHHCPLVSLRRRNEEECDDWSGSLSAEALGECVELLGARGLDLAATPVISLEPELATPDDRRRFVTAETSYAIRVNPEDRFNATPWRPDDPLDSFDQVRVEHLFLAHKPKRIIPIRDLDHRPGAGAAASEEYLAMFDGREGPQYFLVRVALPPGTKIGEVILAVKRLAELAAAYAASTPAEALRVHEFQHPHVGPYCAALRIADRWRYLDGLGKDGPNA